jgi:Xaa-Pro aminopeptidase
LFIFIRIFRSAVFALLVVTYSGTVAAQEGSPAGRVPTSFLEARREALVEALQGAPAILSSAGPRGEYAQDSDYRENNDFFYLTGIEAPGGWLVVNGGDSEEVVLFLPPRSPARERWTGGKLGPGPEARSVTGLTDVRSTEELESDLEEWFGDAEGRWRTDHEMLFLSLGDVRFEESLLAILPSGAPDPRPLSQLMGRLRVAKDAEELRRLRTAVEITSEAHREVWRMAEPGTTEYQVEAVLEYVFKSMGAERVGFPSIVGSGPNSVILHHDKNRRALEEGDLVVVDIGAEFGYYTADITRTFPASGRFSPRQKALYDLVLGARSAGLEMIRPGSTMQDVNRAVRDFYEENSGDLCGDPSCAPYLLHGVAHWLGMDVHDVGGSRTSFVPGMVLTLEPGLYLSEEALGIRIEDDILVTETGAEVLSEALPRTTAEIEAIMREAPRRFKGVSSGSR